MKYRTQSFVLGALVLAAFALPAVQLPWWTFTGGGGVSQHGAVALGGAIGPIAPALSPATGGNYTLSGGFWTGFSGQPQPVSPILKITALGDGEKVKLSWPVNLTGFKLEFATQPGGGGWQPVDETVVKTTAEFTVTVPAPGASRCYRLRSE